jgi:hypothetical protein
MQWKKTFSWLKKSEEETFLRATKQQKANVFDQFSCCAMSKKK